MDVITAPRVLLAGRIDGPGWVAMAEGRLRGAGLGSPPSPVSCELSEGTLAPGLVDAQLNGAFGVDCADGDLEAWTELVRQLTTTGVTAFVPTVITADLEALTGSVRRYRGLRPSLAEVCGARDLGVHVEGPFLSARRRGAHSEELLRDPEPRAIEALLDAGGSDLAYLTLAPERAGALDAIERCRAAGIRVSIGHSDATAAQVVAAADRGATLVTHLYNAQRPLHHRDAGVVGAALTDARLTLGLIADGHHVEPTAIRLAFAAASGRVMLVTDAIAALGMPAGRYELGGEEVEVAEQGPPVRNDGTIAGAAVALDRCLANVVAAGVDPVAALEAATRVPADALGRGDLGRLQAGALADLVWLGDDWHARATWVGGKLAYAAPGVGLEAPV
jgi:N-acetylglucosamine-6-phosphate deacetylase